MRFINSSAILPNPGAYIFEHIKEPELIIWLSAGFHSALKYPDTCRALTTITGIEIPVRQYRYRMGKGDEALIFRLRTEITPDKWQMPEEQLIRHILDICEMGVLRRTE